MVDDAIGMLAECLSSWRRGPYPASTSFVSALNAANMDGSEVRWISDVNNILDLETAIDDELLTDRQREVLYRYVVNGQGQRAIAGVMGISQPSVSIDLEIVLKIVHRNMAKTLIKKDDFDREIYRGGFK